jgi:hypothetical protein
MVDIWDKISEPPKPPVKGKATGSVWKQISQPVEPEKLPEEKNKPSMAQKVASSPLIQFPLGLLKRFTFPLDILKIGMMGEGLSDIDELEELYKKEGLQFDRNEYIKEVIELSKYIPTQQLGEDILKEKTGIDFSPQNTLGKISRGAGELTGLQPNLLKEAPKSIAPKIGAGTAGAVTQESLKHVGVPDIAADLVGGLITGGLSPKSIESPKLNHATEELRSIANKHNLPQYAGMEAETAPKITPVVSEGKQLKLSKEFDAASEKAIDKVLDEKLPFKKLRDQGYNLEDAYVKAYDRARNTANHLDESVSKTGKSLNTNDLIKFIDKKIGSIKSSSPSLSNSQKNVIRILNQEKKDLSNPNSPFFRGNVITGPIEESKEILGPKSFTFPGTKIEKETIFDPITGRKTTREALAGGTVVTPQGNEPRMNLITGKKEKTPKTSGKIEEQKFASYRTDPITGKKIHPEQREFKNISFNQAMNLYKNYNSNVKGIYKKPEFSGSEEAIKNIYGELNSEIINSIEKISPALAEELSFANRVFQGKSKIDQVENIVSKAFSDGYDPGKLSKILGNYRNRRFLERDLGKDAVKDLETIAKYGKDVEKKVFNHLQQPKSAFEYLKKSSPLQLALFIPKLPITVPYLLTKEAATRAKGYLFTRDPTRKSVIDYLKAAATNPAGIAQQSAKLTKSIEDEFGSEQEFLRLIQEEPD